MRNCIIDVLTSSTFWTALSAIATAIMVFFTYLSILNSKKQLAEMKRQWDDEHKPILDISLVHTPYNRNHNSSSLQIINKGKKLAENVKIEIDSCFIENIPIKSVKDNAIAICKNTYRIPSFGSLLVPMWVFDESSKYDDTIFGQVIKMAEYEDLIDYLNSTPIKVRCFFDNGELVERTLLFRYRGTLYTTIERELNNIGWQIQNLRNK